MSNMSEKTALPPTASPHSDQAAIATLIASQFSSLNWDRSDDADWPGFEASFTDWALLVPSARPVSPQSPRAFKNRMQRLREEDRLQTFSEQGVGVCIFVFGNVAIAAAGCEMTENKKVITRDVSLFLLVRTENRWLIAAQAWDVVDDIAEAFSVAGFDIETTTL